MRLVAVLALFVLVGAARADEDGEVCVDRIRVGKPFRPHSRRTESAEGRQRLLEKLKRGVRVSIDGGAPITVSTTKAGRLTAPRSGKHRLAVRDLGDSPSEVDNAWFTDAAQQCYWYREMYDVWILEPLATARAHGRCTSCDSRSDPVQ